jgi:membrane-associated phospholipid phosphatase
MDALGQVGIEFIVWLQGFRSPFLDGLFSFITQFGGAGYLVVIPVVAWSINLKIGLRAMMAMVAAQLFVMILKDYFNTQRPFMVDERIWSEGEFGLSFPSGHAWGAVVYYGYLAAAVRRRRFTIAMGVVIFLVGFSRSYLGVHYPHVVVGGWVLGAFMLWAWLRLEGPVAARYGELAPVSRLAWVTFAPLSLALIHNLIWQNPSTFAIAGAVTGASIAIVGCDLWGWQLESSDRLRKAARILVGAPGLLLLLRVMREAYPREPSLPGTMFIWASGMALSLYIGWFAPWLFELTRLTPKRTGPPPR